MAAGYPFAQPPHQPPSHLPAAEAIERARVHIAGGAFNQVLTDDRLTTPFEQLYRRLPQNGIHDPSVSPSRPVRFEIGSFRVPRQQALILFDLRPDIYRFSGVDASDAVPVESRRFASQIGWEVTIDGRHPGNTKFELEPMPPQAGVAFQATGEDAIQNPGAVPSAEQFAQARAQRFGTASGAATALMPQRPFRYGPSSLPLTLLVWEGQLFQAHAVVFKAVSSPIAFFEFDIAGVLVPVTLARAMLDSVAMKGGSVA